MQVRPLLIYKTGSTLKAALIQFDINNGLSEMCNVKAVVYSVENTQDRKLKILTHRERLKTTIIVK